MKSNKKIPKSEVRNHILKTAKELFLEHGYFKTSLRDISQKGEVSLGRIYVYFKKKEDIFYELVKPVVFMIEHETYSHESDLEQNNQILQRMVTKEGFKNGLNRAFDLIEQYRDEFYLLFFKAEGFKKVDIGDVITKSYKINYDVTIKLLKDMGYIDKVLFDESSINTHLTLYINIYKEFLSKDFTVEEKNLFIENMANFLYYGNLGALEQIDSDAIKIGG